MLSQLVVLVLLSTTVWGANPKFRIFDGTDAKEGTVPYIVSIRAGEFHICGGSIIDKNHVLTAAHCLINSVPEELSVQYGVTTITDSITDDLNISNVAQVSKIMIHDQFYSIDTLINDIGILKLASPIYFDKNVWPVNLPTAFSPTPAYKKAHLAGWGLSYSFGSVTRHLQEIDLKVYSDTNCERIYRKSIPTDRKYHICAGVPAGGKGPCNGDSGGPLTVYGVQIGIVSFSAKPCGLKGYPGVFTKVSSYINWINAQISADD